MVFVVFMTMVRMNTYYGDIYLDHPHRDGAEPGATVCVRVFVCLCVCVLGEGG